MDPFSEAARLHRALERLERQRVLSTHRLNARYDAKRQALLDGCSQAAFRVWCAAADEREAADGGPDVEHDDDAPEESSHDPYVAAGLEPTVIATTDQLPAGHPLRREHKPRAAR